MCESHLKVTAFQMGRSATFLFGIASKAEQPPCRLWEMFQFSAISWTAVNRWTVPSSYVCGVFLHFLMLKLSLHILTIFILVKHPQPSVTNCVLPGDDLQQFVMWTCSFHSAVGSLCCKPLYSTPVIIPVH